MRKKIANLFLAFALFFPCLFMFTACDTETANVTGIEVVLAEDSSYQMTNNTITVQYGTKVSLDKDDFKVTAKLDDDTTKVISLKTEEAEGYTITSTVPDENITPVGDYKITFAYGEDIKVEVNVKVTKATIDMTGVDWDYESYFTYDKSEKEVNVTGLPAGVTVEYEGTSKATNVGEYTVTAIFTYSDNANYNTIPSKELTWEIKKADINVTAVTFAAKTYNGSAQNITKADITSQLPTGIEIKEITGETSGTDAGEHDVVISFQTIDPDERDNYNIPNLNTTWTISKKALTITANDHSITYGNPADISEVSYSGFVTGEDKSDLTGSLNFLGYTAGDPVDKYNITPSGLNSTNYEIDFVPGVLTVEKRALTITAKNHTITYGTNAGNNGVEYTGLLTGDENSLTGTLSIVVKNNAEQVCTGIVGVGSYKIVPSGLESDNYAIEYCNGTLTVNKKSITITPNTVTVEYGTAKNELVDNGVSHDDLVDGDTVQGLGDLTFTFDYETNDVVGTYDITVAVSNQNPNYHITCNTGDLIVTKTNVDVSGVMLASDEIEYTGSNVLDTSLVVGLPTGVTVTGINTDNSDPAIELGEYVAVVSLVYTDTTNYHAIPDLRLPFTIVKGTVDLSLVRVEEDSFEYSGNEVDLENVILLPTGAEISDITNNNKTNVGEYTSVITIVCSDTTHYNDFEETINKTWYITAKALTIAVNNHTITYGSAADINEVTYDGFVTGDDSSDLTGELVLAGYTVGDSVNVYEITPDGLESTNYNIEFVSGSLTVTKKSLDVTANDVTITYGQVAAGNGVTITGYVLGHDDSILNTTGLDYIIEGNTITPTGLISDNYSFNYIPGVLTINKKALTITANDNTIVYGQEGAHNGVSYEGFIDGEDESVLLGQLIFEYKEYEDETFVGYYTTESNVGEYVIEISGLSSENYEITFEHATLTVTPQEIDVSVARWTTKTNYGYTGEAIVPPTLNNIPENVTDSYSYYASDDLEHPVAELISVGNYVAKVTLTVTDNNPNYTLINNSFEDFEFEIGKEAVDLSLVTWGNVNEFGVSLTGESIKPTLQNLPLDLVDVTYTYHVRVGGAITDSLEVGEYFARAEITLKDAENYIIKNDTHLGADFQYSIVLNRIDESKLTWSIDTVVDGNGNAKGVALYTGEDIVIKLNNNTGFALNITYEGDTQGNNIGSYSTTANVTIPDEYREYFEYSDRSYSISWSIEDNPFAVIKINDEVVNYTDFALGSTYALGTTFEFTPKSGYVILNQNYKPILNDQNQNIAKFTLDSYTTEIHFNVKNNNDNEYFKNVYIQSPWLIDEITIGSTKHYRLHDNYDFNQRVELAQNENSLTINFDENYLDEFDSIQLVINDDYENPVVIDEVPFVLDSVSDYRNIQLYVCIDDSNFYLGYICIIPFTIVETINFTAINLTADVDGEEESSFGYQSSKYLDNSFDNIILTGYSITYKQDFSTEGTYYSKLFTDKTLSTEIEDFKTVNNLVSFVIAIYATNGDTLVETIYCNFTYEFDDHSDSSKTLMLGTKNPSEFYATNKSFDFTFRNNGYTIYTFYGFFIINEGMQPSLTLTNEVYVVEEYTLKVTYGSTTYKIVVPVKVNNYLEPKHVFGGEKIENYYMQYPIANSDSDEKVYFYPDSNYMSFRSTQYNNLTISQLDLNNINITLGNYIEVENTRTLYEDNDKIYLKLTLLPTGAEDTETNYVYTYVLLDLEDVIDDDASAEIRLLDLTTQLETPITDNSQTIAITNPSVQAISVHLTNRYATAIIYNSNDESVATSNSYGDLYGYMFDTAGDYTLVITPTSGENAVIYNITVAEVLPLLQMTINGVVYSMDNPNDPESDFYPENEGAKLVAYLTGDFSNSPENITVTSFISSMFDSATLYYDESRQSEIDFSQPFNLSVVTDEGPMAFARFYTSYGNAVYLYMPTYVIPGGEGGGQYDEDIDSTSTEIAIEGYDAFHNDYTYTMTQVDESSYTLSINTNTTTFIDFIGDNQYMEILLLSSEYDPELENYEEALLAYECGAIEYVFQEAGTYYLLVVSADGENFKMVTITVTGNFDPLFTATLIDGDKGIDTEVSMKLLSDGSISSETAKHFYDMTTGGEYHLFDNHFVDFLGESALQLVNVDKLTLTNLTSNYGIYKNKTDENPISDYTFDIITDTTTGVSYVRFYLKGIANVRIEEGENAYRYEEMTSWVVVTLYLMDAEDYVENYPLTITVGNYSFDFKFQLSEILNHGPKVQFYNLDGMSYVVLTPEQIGFTDGPTTTIQFQVNTQFQDASYVVLTNEGFYGLGSGAYTTFQEVIAAGYAAMPSLKVSEPEELSEGEEGDATPVYDTITVDFTQEYVILWIAAEGYNGTLETAEDYFMPLILVLDTSSAGDDSNSGVEPVPGESGESGENGSNAGSEGVEGGNSGEMTE